MAFRSQKSRAEHFKNIPSSESRLAKPYKLAYRRCDIPEPIPATRPSLIQASLNISSEIDTLSVDNEATFWVSIDLEGVTDYQLANHESDSTALSTMVFIDLW